MDETVAPADLRISDADRDQAIAQLSEHFQAGRLTTEEFDERSGAALQARTGRELAVLFTDLPPVQAQAARPGSVPSPGRVAGNRGWRVPVLPAVVAVIALAEIGLSVGGPHPEVRIGFGGLLPLLIVLFVIRRLGWIGNRGSGPFW